MKKQKEIKLLNSEYTITAEQQLEKDALYIIKTIYNKHYNSLKEVDLMGILRAFPAED